MCGKLGEFQKRGADIKKLANTFTRQQFAPPGMTITGAFTAAQFDGCDLIAQIRNQLFHMFGIVAEFFGTGVHRRFQYRHRPFSPFFCYGQIGPRAGCLWLLLSVKFT
jgi:hypothetical protein